MIYICTNKEIIASAISTTREQDVRLKACCSDEYQIACIVVEDFDPNAVVHKLSPEFDWTTERSFRDWRGGRIQQFHKQWGALLAYDEDKELPSVEAIDAAISKELNEMVEAEIVELERAYAEEQEATHNA